MPLCLQGSRAAILGWAREQNEGTGIPVQLLLKAVATFRGVANWNTLCTMLPEGESVGKARVLPLWTVWLEGKMISFEGLDEDTAEEQARERLETERAVMEWSLSRVGPHTKWNLDNDCWMPFDTPSLKPSPIRYGLDVCERSSDDDPSMFIGFRPTAMVEVRAVNDYMATQLALRALSWDVPDAAPEHEAGSPASTP